jgi:hypothetical protein
MVEGFCTEQINTKDREADTRKETTRIMKENNTGTKHKWKTCRV